MLDRICLYAPMVFAVVIGLLLTCGSVEAMVTGLAVIGITSVLAAVGGAVYLIAIDIIDDRVERGRV